jgi:hypothetical protein
MIMKLYNVAKTEQRLKLLRELLEISGGSEFEETTHKSREYLRTHQQKRNNKHREKYM